MNYGGGSPDPIFVPKEEVVLDSRNLETKSIEPLKSYTVFYLRVITTTLLLPFITTMCS